MTRPVSLAVFKCGVMLNDYKDNVFGMVIMDLVFFPDGTPYVVFEWEHYEDGAQLAKVKVALDPLRLQDGPALFGQADYLYRDPLVDPRTVS